MKKTPIFLYTICLAGTLYHLSFLHLNEVLKIADSFAYLQMADFIQELSGEGLGNGWFGFVYSLPIALTNTFIHENFLAAKIVNILLLNISAFLTWKIARKVLSQYSALFAVAIFYLSPTFLHFNIHVLSENIYVPLFLGLFICTYNFIEQLTRKKVEGIEKIPLYSQVVLIACLIGLMYLTRAEAFIYIGSIGGISIALLLIQTLSLKNFCTLGVLFCSSFLIFISPYIWYLHTLTGEWGLTNKGASNLRQAELRGIEQMDDMGFEQAVAELSPDNDQLIAGFAGGMPYVKPQIEGSLSSFISKDPSGFIKRILQNQYKLFTKNIPEIFLGKAPKLYYDTTQDIFFKNIFFLIFCSIPLLMLGYGMYFTYKKHKIFFYSSVSFFLPGMIFFTLFFTLNRYFLIFLPLMCIMFSIGLETLAQKLQGTFRYIIFLFVLNIFIVFGLSTKVYYSIEAPKDEYYSLKQEAGIWLRNNGLWGKEIRIMERFPITTYYSGAQYRWITPYTNNISYISEYALKNGLDILIVDTMDFATYRPDLKRYLSETPKGFTLLKSFSNSKDQKVILYTIEK